MKIKFIIWLIGISLLFLGKHVSNAAIPKSGPFNTRLVRTEPCGPDIKLSRPYDKNPFCRFYSELYNTTKRTNLIRGNFTVLRLANMKDMLRLRGYYWKDGKWQIKYYFNNIACNGPLRTYMRNMVKINLEQSGCNYPKGTFNFEGLDYNQMDHLIWSKDREYGRMLWVVEMFTKIGVQFCKENEVVIEPI